MAKGKDGLYHVEETDPRQQGLKPQIVTLLSHTLNVEETDPRQQGLKQKLELVVLDENTSKRLIQDNKD